MILKSLIGLALVVNVSLDSRPAPDAVAPEPPALSDHRGDAALLPLVQRAAECILQRIAADPRAFGGARQDDLAPLIVAAMPGCGRQLRAVADIHDRMYGRGTGQTFLRGPFLDVLPAAIARQTRTRAGMR